MAYAHEQHPSADRLPPALHALLAARLDQLDTAGRSALALGAVAGDAFETGALHALADGITRAELEQACDRLVRRDLLVPLGGGALRFRHDLVREAAYASLAKSARARLHERHAAWLEGLSDLPEADARIGFHLETACRYEEEIGAGAPAELVARAGRRLEAAARVARGRGDLLGEISFLDRATAVLGTEGPQGAALLPALVSALSDAGSSRRAEELADRAVRTSASLGLSRVGARAAIERERIRLYRHPESFDVQAAMTVVDAASATLRDHGDELGQARAAYLMSDLSWLRGDTVTSYAEAERMLAHARRAGSGFDVATALIFMAWGLVEGPLPAAEAIARCDVLTVEAAGQRAAELNIRGCRAVLTAMSGDYAGVRHEMAEARAGLAELHLGVIAAYLALLGAIAETLAGDPVAAERAVRDAEAMIVGSEARWYLSFIYADLAHAVLAQHRLPEAAEAVARLETLPAPCDAEWVIKRHTARALLAAEQGEPERGLADARAAVAVADETHLIVCRAGAHRTLAELLSATGQADEAGQAARQRAGPRRGEGEQRGRDQHASALLEAARSGASRHRRRVDGLDVTHVLVIGGGNAGFCAAHAAVRARRDRDDPREGAGRGRGRQLVLHGGRLPGRARRPRRGDGRDRRRDHARACARDSTSTRTRRRRSATTWSGSPRAAATRELTGILIGDSQPVVEWLAEVGIRWRLMYERQAYERDGQFVFWGGLALGTVDGGKGLIAQHTAAAQAAGIDVRYDDRGDRAGAGRRAARRTGATLDGRRRACSPPAASRPTRSCASATSARAGGARWCAATRSTPARCCSPRSTRARRASATGAPATASPGTPRPTRAAATASSPTSTRAAAIRSASMVNRDGRRFVDEGADFRNYTYARYGREILAQPGGVAFQLFDANLRPLLRSRGVRRRASHRRAGRHAGRARRGKLGIDAPQLEATVREFNAAIRDDVPFDAAVKDGRAAEGIEPPKSHWAQALETPPYYGFAVTCGVTFTFGGVHIDEHARVLDEDGAPIPGLYAAGELVGGLFHGNYPGGTGLTAGAVFGRRAGTHAATA